jgi:YHS domain-containing protein
MTMKLIGQTILAGLVTLFFAVQPAYSGPSSDNVDKGGLAIQGYDPVSYHSQGPVQGQKELSFTHEGSTYLFSSAENRQQFEQDPERYIPAYGGWCAWAMLDGEKVEVDPETYKIVDGQTLLFYNTFFANTLKKWNELAGSEGEENLSDKAREHWAALNQ